MASRSARLRLLLTSARRAPVVAGLGLMAAGAIHPVVVLASDGSSVPPPEVHIAVPDGADARVIDLSAATATTGAATTTTTAAPTPEPVTRAAIETHREATMSAAAATITGALDRWPHPGPLTGWWGEPRSSHLHTGIDIDGDIGDPIAAAGPGRVILTGELPDYAGYGLVVLVDHGPIRTLYTHLSAIHVEPGQILASGTVVGAMGVTGNTSGSHLHFEVRQGDTPVDPRPHLPAR